MTMKEIQWRSIKKQTIEMINKYAKRAEKKINTMVRMNIYAWYKDYQPHIYHRKRTLYHAFNVSYSNGHLRVNFGPEDMYDVHRVSPEYIYENSFVQGFHGGANQGPEHPNSGQPWWRTPPPKYSYWSSYPATYSWPSPYEKSVGEIKDYMTDVKSSLTAEFSKKVLPRIQSVMKM